MKKNKIILFSCALFLFSCKKEDKNFISSNSLFNGITNLEQYDNVYKKDIDTLINIKASNDRYILEGYISKKTNKKTGWWSIQDKNNEINKLKLQYNYFEGKENINQFIFYKNNIIDSTRSKFYLLYKGQQNNKNIVTYCFITPKSKESVLSTSFHYIIMDEDNGILKESKIEGERNKNYHQFKLEVPLAKKVIIKGLFSEILNVEDKSLGVNEVFTEDLITSQDRYKSSTQSVKLFNVK